MENKGVNEALEKIIIEKKVFELQESVSNFLDTKISSTHMNN